MLFGGLLWKCNCNERIQNWRIDLPLASNSRRYQALSFVPSYFRAANWCFWCQQENWRKCHVWTSAEVNKIDFVDRIYNESRDRIMGPLRIRVLSLESKLTPHARPVVDRRDGTLGKFLISFFPPYLLVSDGYFSSCFSRGSCCRPRRALSSGSWCPQQCLFLMLFWVWKQRSLRKVRLRYVLGKDVLISVRVIVDARVMCKKSPNANPSLNKETLLALRSVLEHNRRQKKNKVLSHMSLPSGRGGGKPFWPWCPLRF